MERKPLSWSRFSYLLIITFLLSTLFFLFSSRWSYLFLDRKNEEIVPIKVLKVIAQNPSLEILAKIQRGEIIDDVIEINVSNHSLNEVGESFKEQIIKKDVNLAKRILDEKSDYIFFAELDREALKKIKNPRLVFFGIWSSWRLYFDSEFIEENSRRVEHFIFPVTFRGNIPKRIIFWAKPETINQFSLGLDERYGISIRSIEETRWVINWLSNHYNYFFGIIFSFYVLASLLVLNLYFFQSPREYRDVLAFGLLTGFISLLLLTRIPIFYDEFIGRGKIMNSIRLTVYLFICLSLSYLTTCFFRLENDKKISVKLMLWLHFALSLLILISFLPVIGGIWEVGAAVMTLLSFMFCVAISFIGFARIREVASSNINRGVPELNGALPRRYIEIVFFIFSLSFLTYFFTAGYFELSSAGGKEAWIAWSLAPTGVLLIQFFMMVGRGANESKKLLGQLSELERLVETSTSSVFLKNYCALIVTYDVRGFTTMQFIESLGADLREELMGFLGGGWKVFR